MAKGEVTLKDIARTVGKSVATVSKALHGHADISLATREAVRQVARDLGYRPNITARRLQKKQTETLGLVVPARSGREVLSGRLTDPFFAELLSGIADYAATKGFDLLVSTRSPGEEEHSAYQHLVSQQRVDGLVVAQPRLDDWRIAFLAAERVPFIVVGHFDQQLKTPGVFIDTVKGLRQGVNHLITQGRRNLALIPPPSPLSFSAICRQAFVKCLETRPAVRGQMAEAVEAFSQKAGYRATQMLLAANEPPDGILACHDLVAMGAMAAIQDQGFEVGSDIAVVGFGDILLSEHTQPPLTSIHQPTYIMGQQACQMVIDLIAGEFLTQRQILIEPWLVVRQSSGLDLWL